MEGTDFEIREFKFYPYMSKEPSQANDNTGNSSTFEKMTIGQFGAFNLDFHFKMVYEASRARWTNTGRTVNSNPIYRLEIAQADEEFRKRFEVGDTVRLDLPETTIFAQGTTQFINDQVIEFAVEQSGATALEERVITDGYLLRNLQFPPVYEIEYNFTDLNAKSYANGFDGGAQSFTGVIETPNIPQRLVPTTGGVKNWTIAEYAPQIWIYGIGNDYTVDSEYASTQSVMKIRTAGKILMLPYWNESLKENYEKELQPEEYFGAACPKLAGRVKVWRTKDKKGKPVVFEFEKEFDTGFLNENGNGGETDITVSSVEFYNVDRGYNIPSLSGNEATTLKLEISRTDGTFKDTDFGGLQVFKQAEFEEYNESKQGNGLTYLSSWSRFPLGLVSYQGKAGKQEINTTLSDIRNQGKTLYIEADFNTTQTSRERIEESDSYVFLFHYFNEGTKEVVTVKVDANNYNIQTDEKGLVECLGGRVFDPDIIPQDLDNALNDGYSSARFWNEDGIIAYWQLKQNGQGLPLGEIVSMQCKLIANRTSAKDGRNDYLNPEDYIEIQSVDVPFTVNNKFSLPSYKGQAEREFNLAENDIFKDIRVNTFLVNESYSLTSVMAGLKINWQYWNRLEGVPDLFINESDAFDGKNERTSNYSEKPTEDKFETKVVLFVECQNQTNPNTTTYAYEIPVVVFDYGEDNHTREGDFADFTGTISTEKLDGTDLNGNVLTTEDTKLKIHWVNNGRVGAGPVYWFMCRIEEALQPSFDIWELSNIRTPLTDSPLQPLAGEQDVKITPDGSNGYFVECRVDYTKLKKGVGYKLSGRMGVNEEGAGSGFGYSEGFTIGFNS